MKKIVLFLSAIFLITFHSSTKAQEFVFDYNQVETTQSTSYISTTKHPFGAEFTSMMQLLRESYTHAEENSLSLTTSTVVDKPSIFYSVKRTSKHLVKAVKKRQVSLEEAKKELEDILVKALNIRHQNTQVLEKKLFKLKNPENIIAFYNHDVSLNI
ncbi:hypothetical protein SAMN04488029_3096 [Reichenbachiella faecimaris]|uniref:Uncharacterized protein n=1 Tax=Reichenbachiella faecimaris TaxID=692418 RepID=A0A1W2GKG2_REIFA|nr:hypothetical protein [Reichenbachiella faecimaris]SMD36838.1 hypothetical protein SAMN04488029_3096 [Reichenbachiella faecimaris]